MNTILLSTKLLSETAFHSDMVGRFRIHHLTAVVDSHLALNTHWLVKLEASQQWDTMKWEYYRHFTNWSLPWGDDRTPSAATFRRVPVSLICQHSRWCSTWCGNVWILGGKIWKGFYWCNDIQSQCPIKLPCLTIRILQAWAREENTIGMCGRTSNIHTISALHNRRMGWAATFYRQLV